MEIYCNEPESDFGTENESDFVTCHDSVIDLSLDKQSARKRISGSNNSRDGLRLEVKHGLNMDPISSLTNREFETLNER